MESVKSNMPSKEKLTFSAEDSKEFRNMIKQCLDRHQIETALFWYDKLVTLTGECKDVYWYADVLCRSGQYRRASTLLEVHSIDKKCLAGRHLRARCHYESKEYATALSLLQELNHNNNNKNNTTNNNNKNNDSNINNKSTLFNSNNILNKSNNNISNNNKSNNNINNKSNINNNADRGSAGELPEDNDSLLASMLLLKGQTYEVMDNRDLAKDSYKQALALDCCCYEAFNNLMQHHMLNGLEETELIESMKARVYPSNTNKNISICLYQRMLKKYNKLQKPEDEELGELERNDDVQVMRAESHFYNCDFHACHDLTSHILRSDPYNPSCLPVHVSVLVELKRIKDLFSLAHKLVDLIPQKEISWFAVGAYYYLINKQEQARRHLSKSTSLNRLFAPAWLMYGHSFALENEHDQAMAAYFSASKLMEGCHLPLMYIALEYMLTNNSRLAEKFFKEAGNIAPEDPFVLHELGIIAFHNHLYTEAERRFVQVLKKIRKLHMSVQPDKWEPLFNNLGHVYRKLKKYPKSLSYHQKALSISPHNASTYTALGFTYALMGELAQAINCFHKSLGLRKDDSFTTSMLNMVTDQHMLEYTPYPEAPQIDMFKNNDMRLSKAVEVADDLPVVAEEHEESQQSNFLSDSSMMDEEMEDVF